MELSETAGGEEGGPDVAYGDAGGWVEGGGDDGQATEGVEVAEDGGDAGEEVEVHVDEGEGGEVGPVAEGESICDVMEKTFLGDAGKGF